jgi:hypothetical protein
VDGGDALPVLGGLAAQVRLDVRLAEHGQRTE